MSALKLITKTIPPVGQKHSATVIFFHGSGDTGSNVLDWIKFVLGRDWQFPHIKLLFPTAPVQPYTPLDGELSNVWFDRNAISIESKETPTSLASIYETVNDLIRSETEQGIPAKRIVVGGFSMGGALALHLAYHLNTELAGVFALSSFLNRGSIVYESLGKRQYSDNNLPELRMFHGDRDTLVPASWGEETFNELKKLGVKGDFQLVKNTLHELKKTEFVQLEEWINKLVPPLKDDDI